MGLPLIRWTELVGDNLRSSHGTITNLDVAPIIQLATLAFRNNMDVILCARICG